MKDCLLYELAFRGVLSFFELLILRDESVLDWAVLDCVAVLDRAYSWRSLFLMVFLFLG